VGVDEDKGVIVREIKFRLIRFGRVIGYEFHYHGSIPPGISLHIEDTEQHGIYHSRTEVGQFHSILAPGKYIRHDSKDQYTGLKDRGGAEIYEGGIVRVMESDFEDSEAWADDDLRWRKVPEKTKVVDVVTMARFPLYWLEHEEFGYEGEELSSPADCEVIGNIHENEELLK